MTKKEFAPVTPGEMLKEEFLAEYGLSQNQLAKAIGISPNRITEIVNNRRRITADTALRLNLVLALSLLDKLDARVTMATVGNADPAGSVGVEAF
jgi:antitoxin HigA-1